MGVAVGASVGDGAGVALGCAVNVAARVADGAGICEGVGRTSAAHAISKTDSRKMRTLFIANPVGSCAHTH